MWIGIIGRLSALAPLFLRQLALSLFSLGFSIFFARNYDISLFASYSNTIILLYFAFSIGDGTFYIPLMSEADDRVLVDSAFSRHQILCVVLAALLIIFSYPISKTLFFPPSLIYFFAISLIFLPFQSANQFFFEKKGNFKTNTFNEVTQSAVFFATLWLTFQLGGGFAWAGLAFVTRALLGCLLAFHWSRYWPRISITVPYFGLYTSIRLVAINVMGFLNSIASPLVLGHFFASPQVAAVNWSVSNASYVQQPFIILNRFLVPFFSNYGESRALNIYRIFSLFYFMILILIFGLSGTILGLVYGQKWMLYINVFYAILLATCLVPISVPTGALASVSGRSDFILKMNMVRLILFWTALIICSLLRFGVWSYVYAQIFAETLHIPTFFIVVKSISRRVMIIYLRHFILSLPFLFMIWYYVVRHPDQLNIPFKFIFVSSLALLFSVVGLYASRLGITGKNGVGK